MARTCETLPNESDAAMVELAQTVDRVGHCGMPGAGGSLEDRAGRVLGVPRDPWHTACAGHHQYTQAWRGPIADSCHPVPHRSSDFGTSYTKLTLQPGVTTVIDNFYICPTNKRKVGAAPATSLGMAGGGGWCHLAPLGP